MQYSRSGSKFIYNKENEIINQKVERERERTWKYKYEKESLAILQLMAKHFAIVQHLQMPCLICYGSISDFNVANHTLHIKIAF